MDAIKQYLKEIRQYPILTPEEELEVVAQIQNGNPKAKEKLINSNLRLAVSIAKKYLGNGLSYLDLIQEANIGLLKAADKFEPSRGFKFSTCASWYIKQTIMRALDNKSKIIRLPAYMVERLNKINSIERIMTVELGREPTSIELAEKLNISIEKLNEFRSFDNDVSSLDVPVNDEDETSVGELIADANSLSPEQSLINHTKREVLDAILNTLTSKEKEILEYRFGLNDDVMHTLEATGHIFNISKERTRQIENKALRKLRNPIRAKVLKEIFTD